MRWISKVRVFLLWLLVLLFAFYNLPMMFVDMESGSRLSPLISAVFVLLLAFSFSYNAFRHFELMKISLGFSLCAALFFGLASIDYKIHVLSEIRSLIMTTMAFLIGWTVSMDETQIRRLLTAFVVCTLFTCFVQITTNIGAFVIADQYLVDNKNSLGATVGTAAMIAFILGVLSEKKRGRYFFFALLVLALFCLLTIRARMATLSVAAMVVYVLYVKYPNGKWMKWGLLAVGLVVIVVALIPSLSSYIFDSFMQNQDADDITNGRIARNIKGLSILAQHPLFGNIDQSVELEQIHCYPLRVLAEKGVFFGGFAFLLWCYQLFYLLKYAHKCKLRNVHLSGFVVLLYPFLISIAEPTFPYGPGTATIFNFILCGMACKHQYEEKNLLRL